MSLLFMDGFDAHGSHGAPFKDLVTTVGYAGYAAQGTFNIDSDTRTGEGYSLKMRANPGAVFGQNVFIRRAIPNRSEIVVGVAIKYPPSTFNRLVMFGYDNHLGTVSSLFWVNSNATAGISLTRGNASGLVGISEPNVIFPNQWHYLEVKFKPHTSAGYCTVRVDGEVVAHYSGNTSASGHSVVNIIQFEESMHDGRATTNAGAASSGAEWQYIDDFYVLDMLGEGHLTDFQGDVMVRALFPIADAAPNEFEQVGGTVGHFTSVNENPPDGDVSYLHTDVSGERELFNVQPLSDLVIDVLAVSVNTRVRKDIPGGFAYKSVCALDAEESVSGSIAVTNNYFTYDSIFEVAPGGGGWTKQAVADMKVGFEAA